MSGNMMKTTTDGEAPDEGMEDAPAPKPVDPTTGQHGAYWILTAEERAKGFVRPVRRSYVHRGIPGPRFPLRDLTAEERERYGTMFAKFETYPESEQPKTGRYWKQDELDTVGKGCGVVTTMSREIAETYARQPGFYGGTFCVGCRVHLPVGADGQFVWDDGSGERVGT